MRWFKHLTSAHMDESLSRILYKYGPEGYGVYWLLLEIVGGNVKKDDSCISVRLPHRIWESRLMVYKTKYRRYIQQFTSEGLIESEIMEDQMQIKIPKLLKYRDEYSKKSGHTPDKLQTDSGQVSMPDTETKKQIQRSKETETDIPLFSSKKSSFKNEEKEKSVYTIFDFWNSKKIIEHKEIKSYKKIINTKLNIYSLQDIISSIENYSKVLSDNKYYWSHRWTLKDFLNRGIEKFLDEAKPLDNFLKEKTKEQKSQIVWGVHKN